MLRLASIALLATTVLPFAADAQSRRTLKGVVAASEEGVPFAGAEIRLTDSDVRVCADASGSFSIPLPSAVESRLRITPIGYPAQEIVVEPGEQTVEVALGDHVFILDEVRVVGYSMAVASDRVSGNSIARLDSKDLTVAPGQSLEAAMQGKVAGAFIQANSGQAGSGYQIILRGINTILGSPDPLVILDGVVISTGGLGTGANAVTRGGNVGAEAAGSRLADINPSDVEKIEVLRGPSASAIYGSRAGNGVVIVTTKRGHTRPRADDGITGDALRCFVPASGVIQIR